MRKTSAEINPGESLRSEKSVDLQILHRPENENKHMFLKPLTLYIFWKYTKNDYQKHFIGTESGSFVFIICDSITILI